MIDVLGPVAETEVVELLEKAKRKWTAPEPNPGWCCDGSILPGTMSGSWERCPNMMAVCRAYRHYGNLSATAGHQVDGGDELATEILIQERIPGGGEH